MLSITDLRVGTTIELEGAPHAVLSYLHSKMGRGGATVRTKLKNLKTNATYERTFHGNDKVEQAHLEERNCTYLYREGNVLTFMDTASFDQFNVDATQLGDPVQYLVEGTDIKMVMYEDHAIAVNLPIKIELKVTHTEPGVRGDTAQGGTKPATVEGGATVTVPLFINIGDVIRVDTRDGSYVERVK